MLSNRNPRLNCGHPSSSSISIPIFFFPDSFGKTIPGKKILIFPCWLEKNNHHQGACVQHPKCDKDAGVLLLLLFATPPGVLSHKPEWWPLIQKMTFPKRQASHLMSCFFPRRSPLPPWGRQDENCPLLGGGPPFLIGRVHFLDEEKRSRGRGGCQWRQSPRTLPELQVQNKLLVGLGGGKRERER